jgi:hypothetical protein
MRPYYTIEKSPNNRQLESEEEEEANKKKYYMQSVAGTTGVEWIRLRLMCQRKGCPLG